jgi:hypothetical protein
VLPSPGPLAACRGEVGARRSRWSGLDGVAARGGRRADAADSWNLRSVGRPHGEAAGRATQWRRLDHQKLRPTRLLTAEGCGTAEIMRQANVARSVVWRWQERFMREAVDGLLRDKTRPSRIPPLAPELVERWWHSRLGRPGRAGGNPGPICCDSLVTYYNSRGREHAADRSGSRRYPDCALVAGVGRIGCKHIPTMARRPAPKCKRSGPNLRFILIRLYRQVGGVPQAKHDSDLVDCRTQASNLSLAN